MNDHLENLQNELYRKLDIEITEQFVDIFEQIIKSGDVINHMTQLKINKISDYNYNATQSLKLTYIPYREKQSLTKQNEILRRALEFYGDKDNWTISRPLVEGTIIVTDLDRLYHRQIDAFIGHGGKTAQQALKEVEGMK